ncbi:MAG TPA: cytochrome c [Dehalococcoidia bacterium]|nr:cytochrome c [Dehalococcoidia bacterium]
MQRRQPKPAAASHPNVERGGQLYHTYCLSCHSGATGGSMMDIPPPHNATGHTWHHSDRQLTAIILDGSGQMGEMMRQMMGTVKDTPRMPAFRGALAEEDVANILAYIKTWWTPEQREWQRRVTESDR